MEVIGLCDECPWPGKCGADEICWLEVEWREVEARELRDEPDPADDED